MPDFTKMTALEIGEGIRKKEFSVAEVVTAVLGAIDEKDGQINAYITVCRDAALKRAQEVQRLIDEGKLTSRLAGVPISIKDNICTKGIKTSCASKMLKSFVPPYNATVIERMNDAGAVIIGKLNMDEFAMGSTTETSYYGAVKNPWDISRVAGGSSGGAAAAVAAGEAVCALGSDTGGSIRQPASYCGITGFKPTYGTVSRYGLIAYASSFDQIGPMAKDASDCAAIMDIICGRDKYDGTSLNYEKQSYLAGLDGNIKGVKIALPKECFDGGTSAEIKENSRILSESVREKVLNAAKLLESRGATLHKISLPFMEYVVPAYYIIASAEASSNLSRFDGVKYGVRAKEYETVDDLYSATRSGGFGAEVKKRIMLGTFVLSSGYYDAYYKKALNVRKMIKREFDRIFSEYDMILTPTAPTAAPLIGESLSNSLKMYMSDIFTVSANIAGLPALSVPCGFDDKNMPVGMQLMGRFSGDRDVLNAGYAYQNAVI